MVYPFSVFVSTVFSVIVYVPSEFVFFVELLPLSPTNVLLASEPLLLLEEPEDAF